MVFAPVLLASYLLGSIPVGYLLGRLRGVDVRQHGSGNIGATNSFRVLGPLAGLAVLVVDAGKGFAAVTLARFLAEGSWGLPALPAGAVPWLAAAAGLAAVAGHDWSPFLGFRGGKGVATTGGVFLALLPWALLVGLTVFAVSFAITRVVSVGSLLGAATFAAAAAVLPAPIPFRLAAWCAFVLILLRHRANIRRLLAGEEQRLSLGAGKGSV
ncbi:MAG: glycerol-3-phosphate 1-O-acyltransferase PlsY [Clostridia bacterium]|nr:glycerol-3-phosphate 1-O-acyltransferase PlsY [Clostridia bacterium]